MIRFATISLGLVLSLGLIIPLAAANGDRRPHHRPPPQAFEACKGLQRGDACTVKLANHTLTGVCDAPPDAPLACRPDGPPPEAIAACDGAKQGDACTIKFDDQTINGTCEQGPDASKPLACRPDNLPPP